MDNIDITPISKTCDWKGCEEKATKFEKELNSGVPEFHEREPMKLCGYHYTFLMTQMNAEGDLFKKLRRQS